MNLVSILEKISDACVVLDHNGDLVFVNEAASVLTEGKEATDGPDAFPLKSIAAQAAASRQPVQRRWWSPARRQWVEIRALPAGDAVLVLAWPGSSTSFATPLEQRLQAQLSDAVRELDSLSYTVSHDLRAPLRHLEAFAGLLQQSLASKMDASTAEYLGVIMQSAQQMSKLLDGVLAYSRLCRRDFNPTRVSLDQALKAVLQELKLEMEGRRIEWDIQTLPDVHADAWMIRQIFVQLLSNAIKFTRPSDPARIRVAATVAAEEVVLSVADNGVGFDMEYGNRLFGLFQRLHSDARFEGSGLGLAHLRRMVQRHGGRVWAESSPNGGATFFVALPRPQ